VDQRKVLDRPTDGDLGLRDHNEQLPRRDLGAGDSLQKAFDGGRNLVYGRWREPCLLAELANLLGYVLPGVRSFDNEGKRMTIGVRDGTDNGGVLRLEGEIRRQGLVLLGRLRQGFQG
jgi:hypothetical protein